MAEPAVLPELRVLSRWRIRADVQRSVEFYKLLGMDLRASIKNETGCLQWVHLANEQAELMFARAGEPVVASQQAVLFYLYSPDLVPLREQ